MICVVGFFSYTCIGVSVALKGARGSLVEPRKQLWTTTVEKLEYLHFLDKIRNGFGIRHRSSKVQVKNIFPLSLTGYRRIFFDGKSVSEYRL